MKKRSPDYILIFVVSVLLIIGILMIFSVSASISRDNFGNTYYFFNHQLLFGLIPGLILAFLVFKIRLQFFKRWALILLLINLILTAMVFLPSIGVKAGGAARWLNFGIITLQPSEFLKLTFIIYLSAWLSARGEGVNLKNPGKNFNQTFAAFSVLISLITLLLVLQPNVSTLGIIIITGSLIYFFSGTPLWHIFLLILVGSLSLFSFIKIAHYRTSRFLVFLKPETEPMGIGYQITQALIAAGSGGLFGLGLGMSQQKFGFLPETLADSIFAVYSEETGFIGGALLVLLFLVLFWRGFAIGFNAKDKFSQILAFGIALWITIQAFVNMGSMLGLLPLAGVPLPFISYGGSALVSELMGVGILLNISKNL
jgi:cell division protein FtsW